MPPTTEIEATYQVVTPCFCGGANQQAEFRLPSFKGVLRFWWRVLAWSRCEGNLEAIRQEEGRLFGSAAGGQSRVLMRLVPPEATVERADIALAGHHGARYLSYGMEDAGRGCLRAPFAVTIRLCCQPERVGSRSDELGQSLLDALTAIGLFGGIGAKSRKGFGSLVLTALRVDGEEQWSPPDSADELAGRIAGFAGGSSQVTGQPEYTAMSMNTRYLLVGGGGVTPMQLVDRIGQAYKDHLREVGTGSGSGELRRAGFGLPRHVGRAQATMEPVSFTRRASPLFIHIHECASRPIAVLSFLPARFLPQDRQAVRTSRGVEHSAEESALYPVVHKFFDRLRDRGPEEGPFTEVVEVRP
jgi:CRISPR-associated protein Cmr1